MIDAKVAANCLERLSGLNWYPRDNSAAVNDLRMALEAAQSETIALFVVNSWIEECADAPKPADLRKLVWAENEKRNRTDPIAQKADEAKLGGCQRCRGCGMTGGRLGGQYAGPWVPCDCTARASEAAVAKQNAIRERILRIKAKPAVSRMRGNMLKVEEVYQGAF